MLPHNLIPAEQQPLFGRRLLVTAPRGYVLRFAQAILDRGDFSSFAGFVDAIAAHFVEKP